ncbi:MAG TPA: hypothetical protein VFG84_06625 [Gemmatimonadaceae bacterium]|nr:hypothetical protein [Gemmatimonadaceae bacterium]
MISRLLSIPFFAALIVVTGCSDDDLLAPVPEACTQAVQLAAPVGATPSFTWTPRCGAWAIIVVPQAPLPTDPASTWGLQAGETLIVPGVQYGSHPAGTTLIPPSVVLEAGRSYIVQVYQEGSITPLGTRAWTP